MKADFLPEPELEFGVGRHIDIRFGLMNYGPLDYASPLAPRQIKVGVVGTPETVEGVQAWFERCRAEIAAKPSRQPNLFPPFPGFNPDVGFRAELVLPDRLQRTIPDHTFQTLVQRPDGAGALVEAADLFLAELRYLTQTTPVDVLVCALPTALVDLMDATELGGIAPPEEVPAIVQTRPTLHDLLKARAMELKKPLQIIRPATYDVTKRRRQKRRPHRMQRLQDDATRAWNIHTALYYKAGGVPWRLVRAPQQFTTCYVGISFYQTLDRTRLLTSVAQVFDERGEGVVVRGGAAQIAKEDRQPHLAAADAYQLLTDALARYREEHRTLPARVVLHKSSLYSAEESAGFQQAVREQRIELVDLVSLHESFTRLFRGAVYPPLRGTFVSLDASSHVLYTRGSVDFFTTYPGMYVPVPLGFRCAWTMQTPHFLALELLALTKMNWNNTQFDGGVPITLRAAQQVGAILKYIEEGMEIVPRYSFYM